MHKNVKCTNCNEIVNVDENYELFYHEECEYNIFVKDAEEIIIEKYTNKDIMKIGTYFASSWGCCECTGFNIDNDKNEISFDFIEHGKMFYASIGINDLSYYDYLFDENNND